MAVAWSPKGRMIASGDRSGIVRLWTLEGTQGPVLKGTLELVRGLEWSPDGKRLAVARNEHLEVHSTEGTLVSSNASASWIKGLTFRWNPEGDVSPTNLEAPFTPPATTGRDGRLMAWANWEPVLNCWDRKTETPLWETVLFEDGGYAVFSGAGQLLHGDAARLEAELVYLVERTPGSVAELWTHRQFQVYVQQAAVTPSRPPRPLHRPLTPRATPLESRDVGTVTAYPGSARRGRESHTASSDWVDLPRCGSPSAPLAPGFSVFSLVPITVGPSADQRTHLLPAGGGFGWHGFSPPSSRPDQALVYPRRVTRLRKGNRGKNGQFRQMVIDPQPANVRSRSGLIEISQRVHV